MAAAEKPWGNNVLVDFDGGIAWVRFNRPDKKNAMSPALNAEMRETVNALATDDRCGVFVLTGEGDAFSAGNVTKAVIETMSYRDALYYTMTGKNFDGKKAAQPGLVNESVPLAQLRNHTRELAQLLLSKNQAALRNAKLAMKRVRHMDWDTSADYLYAKMAEALHLGAAENREKAMKAFLDDKEFKPGVQHFVGTK